MDAAQALADLAEISSQVEAAVLFAEDGTVLGSTLADEEATLALARGAGELLAQAAASRSGDGASVVQLEAALHDGSVFVVREEGRAIVATTAPRPTVGLVFYDLKSCLRGAAVDSPRPKRRRRAASNGKEDKEDGDAA